MLGLQRLAVESAEEPLGGEPAHALGVLADDGQAGVEDVGQGQVVEADVGDGVLEPGPSQGAHRALGDEVLSAEDRRRWPGRNQEPGQRALGPLGAGEPGDYISLVFFTCF